MQRLLNSQRKIIIFAADVGLSSSFPKVGPEQVLGIEIKEPAAAAHFPEDLCREV